ncbi:MAG TPA: hypothetical protein VE863_15395 [Pyrinomonadaceae bacterium]|jgi:hypothetical protein|nr:hypothetical protein [Pyrinomonadaceae bacterium]
MSSKSAPVRIAQVLILLIAAVGGGSFSRSSHAQETKTDARAKPQGTPKPQEPPKEQPKRIDPNNLTAENIAEAVILIAGGGAGRTVLTQIRKNGLERGRETRTGADGKAEEIRYELRFVHGDKIDKDKIRLDSKTPATEDSLISSEGHLFGVINGVTYAPRATVAAEFLSRQAHSIDALLRYKENESKITSAGKDKQQGVELYVIDLVDKADRKTRYFISAHSFRVLSLEYEETVPGSTTPTKFTKRFYDYRIAQGTVMPFRTVLYEDGKLVAETHVLTVQYGLKMDDALFNPETAASVNP